ncbi:MAG: response regulator transcription factor [Flavobacteriales bacterium]|nr:response regulator transcription factor [Flavobacteriales bacterium]
MMDLLIVEDERSLADDIKAYLDGPGVRCAIAGTVREALDTILNKPFDCLVLDLTLPDGNGLEVLRELKGMGRTDGVVIVSAKDALADRIEGLRIGADDYITKPFHLAELAVRVQATVRRTRFQGHDRLCLAELEIDLPAHTASVHGVPVPLTPTEFRLLRLLTASRDRVLPRNVIAEHLTGDLDDDRAQELIYAHMKNLKRNWRKPAAPIASVPFTVLATVSARRHEAAASHPEADLDLCHSGAAPEHPGLLPHPAQGLARGHRPGPGGGEAQSGAWPSSRRAIPGSTRRKRSNGSTAIEAGVHLCSSTDSIVKDRFHTVIARHDELHGHVEPSRIHESKVVLNGVPHAITVTRVIEETEELLTAIALVTLVSLVLLFGGVMVVDHVSARRIWAPFHRLLDELKRFKWTAPYPSRPHLRA